MAGTVEQIILRRFAQLVEALEQEEHLRRQRVTRGVTVEFFQEGIGLRLLQQDSAAQMHGDLVHQRGLADPDRAFYDDVLVAI